MGLDCYIYESKYSCDELNAHVCSEQSHCEACVKTEDTNQIWYGRKTHTIMNMLINNRVKTDDNCTYIDISDIDIEELKTLLVRETIQPTTFRNNEYELDCFVELVKVLEKSKKENPDQYLQFYAWY